MPNKITKNPIGTNQFTGRTHLDWLKIAIEEQTDSCILWPYPPATKDGYGKCGKILAHRYSFFLVNGRWPIPCARHTCDTPSCINPRHIIEGTQQQNIVDMITRKRKAVGSRMPQSKVTEELVRQMRAEYIPWVNGTSKLGRKYGLYRKNVYNIVTRRAWKHVQ